MFCPSCGKEVKEGARFCINCGGKIESGAPAPSEAPVTPEPVAPPVTPEPVAPPAPPVTPEPIVSSAPPVMPEATVPSVSPAPSEPITPPVTPVPSEPVAPPVMSEPPVSMPLSIPSEPEKRQGKGLLVALFALIILLLIGVLGGAVYMLIRDGGKGQKSGDVEELMTQAGDYAEAGKYQKAVNCYRDILEELDPKNEDARNELTNVYIEWAQSLADQGDYEEALDVLEEAGEIVSGKKLDKAVAAIEKAQKEAQSGHGGSAEPSEPEPVAPDPAREEPTAEPGSGGAVSGGTPDVGAEGSDAYAVLQSYYENELVPQYGEVDRTKTYQTSYHIATGYEDAAPEDMVAYPGYVDDVRGSILAHDIRDWDKDGQVELLLICVSLESQNEYDEPCGSYYVEMYEGSDGSAYWADGAYLINDVLGGCDMEYQSFLVKDTADQVYLAVEDMYLQALFADNYGYMAVDLVIYDDVLGFQDLYSNSVRGLETDLFGDPAYGETANALSGYGFRETARMLRDESSIQFEFDEDGDGMEILAEMYGASEILGDFEGYAQSGKLDEWFAAGNPEALGKVYYNFR